MRDRYNQTKIKILAACHFLEENGQVINNTRLQKLTKKSSKQISVHLYRLSVIYPYLSQKVDHKKTDGCCLKFTIKKEGRSVYKKLLARYNQGLDLNLRETNPKPSAFKLNGVHGEGEKSISSTMS